MDIALALDGSNLTKNLLCVISGFKLVDIACQNLHTVILELDPSEANLLVKLYLPQSRRWSFPTKFVMGKETQEMYQTEFKEMFELFLCYRE